MVYLVYKTIEYETALSFQNRFIDFTDLPIIEMNSFIDFTDLHILEMTSV